MNIFVFSPNWLVLLALLAAIFIAMSAFRKSFAKKSELKQQVVFGAVSVALAGVIEILGVGIGLWNYTDGNWPVILWVAYFLSGLVAYQLVKLTTERVR